MTSLDIDLIQYPSAVPTAWVVVAGLYQARLLRFHTPRIKSCQFEELGQIEAPMVAATCERFPAGNGTAGQPYAERYRQLQKEYQRFSYQLACWAQDSAREHAIEQLTVFAPERLMEWLVSLRTELSTAGLCLRTDNLMHACDDELRRNPVILDLLQPDPANRRVEQIEAKYTKPSRITGQQSPDKRIRKYDRPWRVFSPISSTALKPIRIEELAGVPDTYPFGL